MRCVFCAEEIPDGSPSCPICGEVQPPPASAPAPAPPPAPPSAFAPAGLRVVGFEVTKAGSRAMFEGATPEQVGQAYSAFFTGLGYAMTSSDATGAMFEKGSAAARVLAGGFAKRSKYTVSITANGPYLVADVTSAMSGAGGGLLGVSKEKKQRAALTAQLQDHLSRYGASPV